MSRSKPALWGGQFSEWDNTNEGGHIFIAVARYLAAHSLTERTPIPSRPFYPTDLDPSAH
jgi:hypothetical protein